MKQTRKFIKISLTFLLAVYLILFLFPQLIFSNKLNYKSFAIYSHDKLDEKIFTVLDSSENLIINSELYNEKSSKKKIFLCNSFFEYSFFAPTQRHAFACTNSLTNNIMLSKSNILFNKIERNGNENNIRTLSGTIAHEITHILIENKIGFLKNIWLDTWKKEGYCDFIAKESSFDFATGIKFLCNNEGTSSTSFQYFKYRLYVDYLIKDKSLYFSRIVNDNFDLTELGKALEKKYCR